MYDKNGDQAQVFSFTYAKLEIFCSQFSFLFTEVSMN